MIIIGEESTCPRCEDMLNMDIVIGDGHLYDICPGCGFRRKKKPDGVVVLEPGVRNE